MLTSSEVNVKQILLQRLKDLGIDAEAMEQAVCPNCNAPRPNCHYNTISGRFCVHCDKCLQNGVADSFSQAMSQFSVVEQNTCQKETI
ncbi:MAG TPA: hypothetical protein DEH24_20485 [Alteromonas sp.]|nr:hypothetical protein [Alteromonadaceae bacterium]MAX41462.1 hypothetical protein [Alteromonadaceae bacterium]HBY41819.1 hypothetical protein [Alteromonas sp.]